MSDAKATVMVVPLKGVGKALAYTVPPGMEAAVRVGSLVKIPLGRRVEQGIVVAPEGDGDFPEDRLKAFYGVEQPFPVLGADGLRLGQWMAQYYGCGLEQVFEVMIPRSVRRGMGPRREKCVMLAEGLDAEVEAALGRRAPRQAAVLTFLKGQAVKKSWRRSLLEKRLGVTASVISGLVAKGYLTEHEEVRERIAYGDEAGAVERVTGEEVRLTEEQSAAAEDLKASLEAGVFRVHLLHGVTGSGKTEVYMRLMKEVLGTGGGVIFLVPEVALTPQTVGRLRARFEALGGEQVVVWHSQLSDGERSDAWRAVATGASRVVVGARSAVFAPVHNLKLIIVDEEHEPAYKQEETPRYNGRDVAVYRTMLNDGLCILGSATPALESLRNVELGKYRRNRLLSRVDDRQLPLMHVVDMRREKGPGVFSRLLADKLLDRMEKKEQAILFLNRRGYDASLHCPDCGHVAMCDFCDVTMTHHRQERRLKCHLCGAESGVPQTCPKCRSPKIHYKGSGTQKIEDHLQRLLPHARVVRMDADTMRRRHAFREYLGAFRQGRIDVLVGTQMIAKGLDFPNVTLVGVLDADLSMHLPDFRAAERTFQLMVQVSGRAGRGDRAGEVVVQTYMPASPPIQYGRQQDFDGFTDEELAHRREFGYPPYRHLIHHLIRGPNQEKVAFYSKAWVAAVENGLKERGVEVRGPAACPVERIQNHFRYQIWYFTPSIGKVVPWLCEQRARFKWDRDLVEILDVDAMNLM